MREPGTSSNFEIRFFNEMSESIDTIRISEEGGLFIECNSKDNGRECATILVDDGRLREIISLLKIYLNSKK